MFASTGDQDGNVLGGEKTVLSLDFKSKELPAHVKWVRPDPAGWEIDETAGTLTVSTLPGGIWGGFFDSKLARNFLVTATRQESANPVNAVEAAVTLDPKNWGEQAGVFWYGNDSNYAKFVVEGMKDGSVALVFAVEIGGEPRVVKKLPVNNAAGTSTILRIEVQPGPTFTACIVHPQGLYIRHVASESLAVADVNAEETPDSTTPADVDWLANPMGVYNAHVGIGAHGGPADASEVRYCVCRFVHCVHSVVILFRVHGVVFVGHRPTALQSGVFEHKLSFH